MNAPITIGPAGTPAVLHGLLDRAKDPGRAAGQASPADPSGIPPRARLVALIEARCGLRTEQAAKVVTAFTASSMTIPELAALYTDSPRLRLAARRALDGVTDAAGLLAPELLAPDPLAGLALRKLECGSFYASLHGADGFTRLLFHKRMGGDRIWSYVRPDGTEVRGEWDTSLGGEECGDPTVIELEVDEGTLSDAEHDAICRACVACGAMGVDTYSPRAS